MNNFSQLLLLPRHEWTKPNPVIIVRKLTFMLPSVTAARLDHPRWQRKKGAAAADADLYQTVGIHKLVNSPPKVTFLYKVKLIRLLRSVERIKDDDSLEEKAKHNQGSAWWELERIRGRRTWSAKWSRCIRIHSAPKQFLSGAPSWLVLFHIFVRDSNDFCRIQNIFT